MAATHLCDISILVIKQNHEIIKDGLNNKKCSRKTPQTFYNNCMRFLSNLIELSPFEVSLCVKMTLKITYLLQYFEIYYDFVIT